MTTKSESNDELSENSELRAVKRLYELTIRNLYVQCNILSRLENPFSTFTDDLNCTALARFLFAVRGYVLFGLLISNKVHPCSNMNV